jgi:diacylglycerol kinase (CTP)
MVNLNKSKSNLPGFIVITLFLSPTSQYTAFINVFRLLLVSIAVEIVRLGISPSFNAFVLKALGPVMRSHEGNTVSGNTWYLLGASSVLYFFPLDIASMGIVYLAWCDPFASLSGQSLGRFTYRFANRKTIAGLLGGILMGMFATFVFYGYIAPTRPQETYLWQPIQRHVAKSFWEQTGYVGNVVLPFWVVIVVGGVIAGLSEMLTMKGIDDNFLLPVMSAGALFSIRRICESL